MAIDSRESTSAIFITRTLRNHRNRINADGNRNPIIFNTPDTSPNFVTPKSSPAPIFSPRKVPVLYYLTRNGHVEHPHLIDVSFSSLDGLYLRDVINTLNYYRGKGMANMYSWSFKRSYKNGYVWHDLSEDDLIEVTKGHDYVLKGSELLQTHPVDTNHTNDDCSATTTASLAVIRRRNQSWSSFDNPQEYMVVKCESSRELAASFGANAATQTEEQRKEHVAVALNETQSPLLSSSSSEEVTGAKDVDQTVSVRERDPTVEEQHDGSGRMKASHWLMQLIACGAPSSRLKMQAGLA